jgi:hypothetical protein
MVIWSGMRAFSLLKARIQLTIQQALSRSNTDGPAWIIGFPPVIRSSHGRLRAQSRKCPKTVVRVAHLRNRDGPFRYALHQPATLPLRCHSGKHSWLFDRTAYFPRTLPGWPESRVQEKVRETNSAGKKGEVNDAEELAVQANWRFCLVLCRLCACSSHSSSERSDLNRNN